MNEELELLREKKGFLCDMDGVISVSYTPLDVYKRQVCRW